jgi:hypothetical protein
MRASFLALRASVRVKSPFSPCLQAHLPAVSLSPKEEYSDLSEM